MDQVWVFHGEGGRWASGVFTPPGVAGQWIAQHGLSRTLTAYPLDRPVYDWAIGTGVFKPKQERDTASEFIQRFSSAAQEHFHYLIGVEEG